MSETLWLNVTNIALGVVTLICLLVIGRAVLQELVSRRSRKVAAEGDSHALAVDGLGLTMADGGERIDKAGKE